MKPKRSRCKNCQYMELETKLTHGLCKKCIAKYLNKVLITTKELDLNGDAK